MLRIGYIPVLVLERLWRKAPLGNVRILYTLFAYLVYVCPPLEYDNEGDNCKDEEPEKNEEDREYEEDKSGERGWKRMTKLKNKKKIS